MGFLKKLSPLAMMMSKKGKKPQPMPARAQSQMPAKRPMPQESEEMVTAKKGGSMKKPAGKSTGSFRTSANGIATKGKTKAKQVKMAKGGGMC